MKKPKTIGDAPVLMKCKFCKQKHEIWYDNPKIALDISCGQELNDMARETVDQMCPAPYCLPKWQIMTSYCHLVRAFILGYKKGFNSCLKDL